MGSLGYSLLNSEGECSNCTIWTNYVPIVTITGGGGNVVPIYTENLGRYQKRGKTVFVDVHLNGDGGTEGAGTGIINISLPVQAGANKIDNGTGIIGHTLNNNINGLLGGTIAPSANTISLKIWTAVKKYENMPGDDQSHPDRDICLHFWYESI